MIEQKDIQAANEVAKTLHRQTMVEAYLVGLRAGRNEVKSKKIWRIRKTGWEFKRRIVFLEDFSGASESRNKQAIDDFRRYLSLERALKDLESIGLGKEV